MSSADVPAWLRSGEGGHYVNVCLDHYHQHEAMRMRKIEMYRQMAEDAEDLAAFDQRKAERSVSFEAFVRGLRQRGRI